MELITMSYDRMHEIVLTVLDEQRFVIDKDDPTFFVIGSWYHKWLLAELPELSLKVPSYNKESIGPLLEYMYWLDVLIRLLNTKPLNNIHDRALFDIKKYQAADNYYRRNNDFSIAYLRTRARTHYFDQGVAISADRFVPLFSADQISGHNNLIADLFCLLFVIGKTNLIPHALALDLDKDLALIIKETAQDLNDRSFIKTIHTDEFRYDHDLRDKKLDDLLDFAVNRCLILTYPYHVDVSSTVINEFRGRSKIFRIELSNRFCHEEIDPNQIVLTNAELGIGGGNDLINVLESYKIFETNCEPQLIIALRDLKKEWNLSRFNIFTTPFPVKWLMCVHQGHNLDFWKEQFKKDFSEVSGKLLADTFSIITAVYQLNWIGNFLPYDPAGSLLIPRSTLYPDVISSLKEHLIKDFAYIGYSEEAVQLLEKGGKVYFIDPFNVILLNNISLNGDAENLKIVVPDFIYYTYQPFVRYIALRYYFEAWTGGARERLDSAHPQMLEQWKLLSEEMMNTAKKELKHFNTKKSIKEDEKQQPEELDILPDLSRSELLEHIASKERRTYERVLPAKIQITTSSNKQLILRPQTPVLINENGFLIRTIAAVLESGSLFVPIDEIVKNMDLKKMIDRLVTLSDRAKNWHQHLKALNELETGLYDSLKSNGLSISKNTFEKDYLIPSDSADDLHLPRAKNDWTIVCERLGIDDRQTAWNAVKCRENMNQLKAIYLRIIELMVATGSFGINVSNVVLDQISGMLSELPDSSTNEKKDAIALIAEISGKINLEKIEEIITLAL